MDNLTHGLLGLGIGAVRRPSGETKTDRAVLLASVLAAELPDLDGLWPAPNEVLGSIHVHRGISHALVTAPLWAAAATLVATLIFRGARRGPPFVSALFAVVFAHLAADAWTGWGTRLLLPFSDARLSWDWMVVVDPIFTAPLVLAAVVALLWRARWRSVLLTGLLVSSSYLGARVLLKTQLERRVEAQYADAQDVSVFPDWFGALGWRYVVERPDTWVTGNIAVGEPPREAKTHPKPQELPPELSRIPTVSEAIAWARFPTMTATETSVRIADLRYHLYGEPTLAMAVELDANGELQSARLERPVDPRSLFKAWRAGPPTP